MNDCSRVKELLPLYSGGDVDSGETAIVRDHLLRCSSCATELADYERASADARSAFQGDIELPVGVVARVAGKAASDALRPRWWQILLPMAPRPALVSAVPVALLVLAVGLPILVRQSIPPERGSESPASLNLQIEGGLVHVSWLDGRARPYRVYKSTNPRDLGKGAAHLVRGNEWVDKQADSGPIVFYRID